MAEATEPSRGAILGRIREANRSAGGRDEAYEAIARSYQTSAAMDRDAILKLFAERLREYDARVWEATTATVAGAIRAALGPVAEGATLLGDGFPVEWRPEGTGWMEAGSDVAAIEKAAGAAVTCEVAIAHTGTIVLKGMRRMTLLPDHLLCVVRKQQVVETVPEAFARLQPFAAEALTFISGPSATADIEMTRIRGVHGPRFLDVVLV